MKYKFMRFPGGKVKAVTISYDDGAPNDLRLIEICEKYGIKATLNICSDWVGRAKRLNYDELKQIMSLGHEIASHGRDHKAPGLVSYRDGIEDVLECRRALEQNLGCLIRGYAYPDSGISRMADGNRYERIAEYMQDLEIAYCRSHGADHDDFALPNDWHNWMPNCHFLNPDTFAYAQKFIDARPEEEYIARRFPRLFYLWGHSFEFKSEEAWQKFDDFCALIGQKDDTWYATNIEIYDYTEAYRALRFSVDNTTVTNPTLIDVWFSDGKTDYLVKSGETIVIE